MAIALQLPDLGAPRVHWQYGRLASALAHPVGASRGHIRRDRRDRAGHRPPTWPKLRRRGRSAQFPQSFRFRRGQPPYCLAERYSRHRW